MTSSCKSGTCPGFAVAETFCTEVDIDIGNKQLQCQTVFIGRLAHAQRARSTGRSGSRHRPAWPPLPRKHRIRQWLIVGFGHLGIERTVGPGKDALTPARIGPVYVNVESNIVQPFHYAAPALLLMSNLNR